MELIYTWSELKAVQDRIAEIAKETDWLCDHKRGAFGPEREKYNALWKERHELEDKADRCAIRSSPRSACRARSSSSPTVARRSSPQCEGRKRRRSMSRCAASTPARRPSHFAATDTGCRKARHHATGARSSAWVFRKIILINRFNHGLHSFLSIMWNLVHSGIVQRKKVRLCSV